ncbi:MAG: SGNH/GDSL hydrolase family protein [Pseudomonadota bacterium]
MQSGVFKETLKTAAIVALSGVVTLAVFEALLWMFHPLPDPLEDEKIKAPPIRYIPHSLAPNMSLTLTPEEGLPGVTEQSLFTTNEFGFRGPPLAVPKPEREFRVFLIGGSTMECMAVTDELSPGPLLQARFSDDLPDRTVRVYNGGRSGDISADHVALLAHRIAQLEPDLVIAFAGINDLRAGILERDYLHLQGWEASPLPAGRLVRMLATEFQLPRLMYAVKKEILGQTDQQTLEEIPLTSNYRDKVAVKKGKPVSTVMPRTDLPAYRRNVASLVGIARAQGAEIMLITQATTWNSPVDDRAKNWHWLDFVGDVVYPEAFMDAALEQYNDQIRTLGAELKVPVLDLAKLIPKSLDYFYDDVHFNPNGVQKFVELIDQFVGDNKPLLQPR